MCLSRYDIDGLEDLGLCSEVLLILGEYGKQLLVEQQFYSEYHRSFVNEILDLASGLSPNEKEKVVARSLNGLEENNSIRMRISGAKISQNNLISRLIKIYDASYVSLSDEYISIESDEDLAEAEKILGDLDSLSSKLGKLSLEQEKRK